MKPLLLSLVVAAPLTAFAEPTRIASVDQVAHLCAELSGSARAANPADQATADADAKTRRDAAMKQEWLLSLAPGQFRISEANPASGTLTVDTERAFRMFKGQVVFYPVDEEDLDLAVPEGQPLPTQTSDLTLELLIRPGQDSEQACTVGLAKDYVVGVEVLSGRLVNKAGAAVASLEADPGLERAVQKGGAPAVEIEPAVVEGPAAVAKQVTEGMEQLKPKLNQCYQQGLARQPALDGSLVLGFELNGAHPGAVTVMADSVQDDALAQCVSTAVAALELKAPAPAKGKKAKAVEASGRASVALRFERK